ncbi:MAG: AAA family ATPase, partial [Planctomycetota bacterium]
MKALFTLGEVARMVGLEGGALRRLEREGSIPTARRTDANQRVYTFDEAHRLVLRFRGSFRRRLAVVNQKGGVGKTTTAFNLAGALAARGRRVLAVDLDPQADLTSSLVDLPDDAPSTEDLFSSPGMDAAAVVRPTPVPGVDLVPARTRLAGVETRIAGLPLRETLLGRRLAPLAARYEIVLMDCPPNLSLVTVNALAACDEAIVPLEAHVYSIRAVADLPGRSSWSAAGWAATSRCGSCPRRWTR